MGSRGLGRNFKQVVRKGFTEEGRWLKGLSQGYIWEDFQSEETSSAKALRGPGGFKKQWQPTQSKHPEEEDGE